MERFKIGNLWVHFPFVPYAPQEIFMRKMIESMDNAQNALLESPTGTGKTLCLLCASLAWVDNRKKMQEMRELYENDHQDDQDNKIKSEDSKKNHGNYKIYFCTRTHSQLIQAVNEFKETSYGHLRSTALGSRKQLCLNPCALSAGSNLDDKCASLRKVKRENPCNAAGPDIEDLPRKCTSCLDDHRCQYYVNYEEMIVSGRDHSFTDAPAMNQRSLIEKCRKHKVCPYYMSRHLQKTADIVFLPYTYIFNPHILKGLSLNLTDSVVIIDEGHNLEKVCEENASFEMKISDITSCENELLKCLEYVNGDEDFPLDVGVGHIEELEKILKKLKELLSSRIEPGLQIPHYDGKFCLQIFEDSGFTRAAQPRLTYNILQLSQFLGAKKNQKTDGMKKIASVVNTLFNLDSEENDVTLTDSFVLYKEVTTPEQLQQNPNFEPKISFWCFNAGIIMKALKDKGVRSFIVTSGTLAPLGPLKKSLTIPFEVDLLNEHVVDSSQVLSLCITEAPTCSGDKRELLDASYINREENGDQLYDALGNVIREVARNTPKGVLIFFPSSKVKIQCLTRWNEIFIRNNLSLFHEINSLKEIFEEPKEASELNELQLKYTSKIKNSSGACLIGVTSGKVSEGIDFKDDLGRAVIMIGLPYPPCKEPWVIYKRNHLCRTKGSAVENEWYLSQAIRPVNQALGRIIRHQKDFGVVILPNDRYSAPRVRRALPHWIEKGLRNITFEELRPMLKSFFSQIVLRIKEIEKKTEREQDKIRSRHRQELKKEDCPTNIYLDLRVKRDQEREKNERLVEDIQMLMKKIKATNTEIENISEEAERIAHAFSVEKGKSEKAVAEVSILKEENDSISEDRGQRSVGDTKVTEEKDSCFDTCQMKGVSVIEEASKIKQENNSCCESKTTNGNCDIAEGVIVKKEYYSYSESDS